MEEQTKKGFTKNGIKIVAMVTMFIDHFGAILIEPALMEAGNTGVVVIGGISFNIVVMNAIYFIMRFIGRIAFPIFCYSLVEGFCYTKSVWKYALRIVLFSLVTEIPFDLAFSKSLFYWGYQSVLVTLLLGLLTLICLKFIHTKLVLNAKVPRTELRIASVILQLVTIFAGISVAELLKTDYAGMGVLAIVIMYYLHEEQHKLAVLAAFFGALFTNLTNFRQFLDAVSSVTEPLQDMISISPYAPTIIVFYLVMPTFIALFVFLCSKIKRNDLSALGGGCAVLTVLNMTEIFAFFGLIFLAKYNGKRGYSAKWTKYICYAFYPAHILLIYLLAVALGIRDLPW